MLAGEHAATLLDAVHLPLSMLDEMPHELSKGQRQRVAIARSLVLEPALLVADDPTAGIDVTVRSHILDVLAQLQERRAFAALVVTADLAEVRRITDRVASCSRGASSASARWTRSSTTRCTRTSAGSANRSAPCGQDRERP